MTSKKTVRIPLTADGIPVVVDRRELEKTREIPDSVAASPADAAKPASAPGAPHEIVEDEQTVPVHSSIESSLTFEVLRRQSTDDDEGGEKPKS
jgi:hypothetical protein